MQDGIKVDFEDDLPFHQFAVRMSSSWIFRLPEVLETLVKNGKAKQLQANLR